MALQSTSLSQFNASVGGLPAETGVLRLARSASKGFCGPRWRCGLVRGGLSYFFSRFSSTSSWPEPSLPLNSVGRLPPGTGTAQTVSLSPSSL